MESLAEAGPLASLDFLRDVPQTSGLSDQKIRSFRGLRSARKHRASTALQWNDRAYEERLERATLQVRAALLTPREREIFELVATGEPNKVVARNSHLHGPDGVPTI